MNDLSPASRPSTKLIEGYHEIYFPSHIVRLIEHFNFVREMNFELKLISNTLDYY